VTRVAIDGLAAGGAGVGRLADGMTVFVPRTALGDVVEIRLAARKPRYALGSLIRVLEPGPDRTEPSCRHYVRDRCGGCQLQHLSPHGQRAAKSRLVVDALHRIGGRREVEVPSLVPSPDQWRYRSRITLAARGGRFGLHPYDRPDQVFEPEDCLITAEPLLALWREVRVHRTLLPPDVDSLSLRQDRAGELHVVVGGGSGNAWDAAPLARALARQDVSYWWRPSRGAARVVAGPRPGFPALAFEQVNPTLARRIRGEAVQGLGEVTGRAVWDLYGGVGDAAELLVARGARVWTVDRDRSAVRWGEARDHSRGGVPLRRIAAPVEEALHRLPAPDAVLVNPPRSGLHERVSRHLERWAAQRPGAPAAYVSCDPATLARDLARMPSLRIRGVTAYDLFPQTAHVETLVLLQAACATA
jgi:23S rRNA (uracil1939-C5)-methyltransferase